MGFLVVGFGMFDEYPRNISGQGTVDEHRKMGNVTFRVEFVQNIKKLLGSAPNAKDGIIIVPPRS